MIADTFIRRPVTAIVISIVIVVVGVLAIGSLAIGQYPEITPPTVTITATYNGADALTVEITIAVTGRRIKVSAIIRLLLFLKN